MKGLIRRFIMEPYWMKKYGRFQWMKLQTDGLLGSEQYEEIHRTFSTESVGEHDIVEVGGASGSASISIAWALKEKQRQSKLIVVEKFEDDTRSHYGGFDENHQRFQDLTKRYGIADYIRLFPDYLTLENSQQAIDLVSSEKIGGLMLDADGHIHRDFLIFWDKLVDGAPIVIDGYDPDISVKHEITYHLVNRLVEWELIELRKLIGDTFFGVKGKAESIDVLNVAECEAIVDVVCEHYDNFDRSGIILTP